MKYPRDIAAEDALLGSLLLFETSIDEVWLIVRPSDFSTGYGPKLFRTLCDLRKCGTPIDELVVCNATKADPDIDDELIMRLMECVPHGQNFEHWAHIVREMSNRRRLYCACDESLRSLCASHESVERVASTLETEAHSVLDGTITTVPLDAGEILQKLAADRERTDDCTIATGYSALDSLLSGGLRPGSLNVLAARTSVGKTAFAGCLTRNMIQAGHHVLFITLEMSAEEIVERILALLSNIPAAKCERLDGLSPEEFDRLAEAENSLASMPLTVFDHSCSMETLASVSRLYRRRKNTRLIVLDYLSLVAPHDRRAVREQQIATITRDRAT